MSSGDATENTILAGKAGDGQGLFAEQHPVVPRLGPPGKILALLDSHHPLPILALLGGL